MSRFFLLRRGGAGRIKTVSNTKFLTLPLLQSFHDVVHPLQDVLRQLPDVLQSRPDVQQ